MDQEKIGEFISKIRKEKKLTQEEFAEKLGVSSKSVSRWENGKCMPDLSLLIPISKELSVSLNELLIGEKKPEENSQEKLEENTIKIIKELRKKFIKKLFKILIITILSIISIIIIGIIGYNLVTIYLYQPDYYFNQNEIEIKVCDHHNRNYLLMKVKDGYGANYISDYDPDSVNIRIYKNKWDNKHIESINHYPGTILLEENIEKVYYDSKLIWDSSIETQKCKEYPE